MDYNVSYLIDSRGRRRSVVLSMADWKKMQLELERARVKADLREALAEIREIEAGRQPAVTLQDFLQEWDNEQQQTAADGQCNQAGPPLSARGSAVAEKIRLAAAGAE